MNGLKNMKKKELEYSYNCMPRHYLFQDNFHVTPVQPYHIEKIRQWRNAQINVLRQSNHITTDQQKEYYNSQIWPDMRSNQPKNILLSYHSDNDFIGYGGLVHISWIDRRAEISFLLDPKLIMKPDQYAYYFNAFLVIIKRLAFSDLGLERLHTETYASRKNVISILEDSGFLREGELRNHVLINGKYQDSIIHGRLASDEGTYRPL
jgi:RimJ/RimL family protein N-acetyltransferase